MEEFFFLSSNRKIKYPLKKTNLRSAIGFLLKSATGLAKNYSLYAKYQSHNIATLHEGFAETEKITNKCPIFASHGCISVILQAQGSTWSPEHCSYLRKGISITLAVWPQSKKALKHVLNFKHMSAPTHIKGPLIHWKLSICKNTFLYQLLCWVSYRIIPYQVTPWKKKKTTTT